MVIQLVIQAYSFYSSNGWNLDIGFGSEFGAHEALPSRKILAKNVGVAFIIHPEIACRGLPFAVVVVVLVVNHYYNHHH